MWPHTVRLHVARKSNMLFENRVVILNSALAAVASSGAQIWNLYSRSSRPGSVRLDTQACWWYLGVRTYPSPPRIEQDVFVARSCVVINLGANAPNPFMDTVPTTASPALSLKVGVIGNAVSAFESL